VKLRRTLALAIDSSPNGITTKAMALAIASTMVVVTAMETDSTLSKNARTSAESILIPASFPKYEVRVPARMNASTSIKSLSNALSSNTADALATITISVQFKTAKRDARLRPVSAFFYFLFTHFSDQLSDFNSGIFISLFPFYSYFCNHSLLYSAFSLNEYFFVFSLLLKK